ncbi:MAG: hypothetical protein CMJ89_09760 [Planctomycetes bacterium]|nr:hypothetical protein [Planctomycetota bacterium]
MFLVGIAGEIAEVVVAKPGALEDTVRQLSFVGQADVQRDGSLLPKNRLGGLQQDLTVPAKSLSQKDIARRHCKQTDQRHG